MKAQWQGATVITWLAGVTTAMVVLIFPLGYFVTSYQYMLGRLEAEAEINGRIISQIIIENPEFWRFEQVRLEEYLARRPSKYYPEKRRVLDNDNKIVAENSNDLNPPLMVQSYALRESGAVVGRLEIYRSLRPLLMQTGLVFLMVFPVGLAAYITVRILPVRAVQRAETALRQANVELSKRASEMDRANAVLEAEVKERQRAEEEVRRLNEALEIKVAERTRQLAEAQDKLVRKEKLATLGQVAGSVGHELRNPLGVMNNAVYFLKTVMTDADETTKEYLDIIRDEISGAERIVSDLLGSVRTKPPCPEQVKVGELISACMVKCRMNGKVAAKVEAPGTLPSVKVDPLQMSQVFINLINNAMDAMPAGGALDIKAEEDGDGRALKVRVSDTGEGIAPENMVKLFQPLFTTKARGIGLGLTVVKNLVEVNGGKIVVESRPGEGTAFTVTLPVHAENMQQEPVEVER